MTDIRIVEVVSLEAMTMDWLLLPNGQLDTSEELATAVSVALGTNRLADFDEILPDPDSTDRQGWWGDYQAQEIWNGWPIGSKHWLLRRAKITDAASLEGSTVQRAANYTTQAIQPFIDNGICTSFIVNSVRVELDRVYVKVTIFRGPKTAVELQYQILWDQLGT
jgi:phage gp46-like protein